jgi:diaminohydroxyphosphoribosylaminopyrimidine deaminase/5-amino-6-(5-phosphoribosylamino)uracil reductase
MQWRMNDADYMRQALQLARRGEGRVEPNPMVGCVLVKDNRVIGRGYHQAFGGPHAEVNALGSCRQSPNGTTAYVTLEPCCYHGKTPPCVQALIEAGIQRVVASAFDPNPKVNGQGFALLRQAGISVTTGVCAEAGQDLIAPFTMLTRKARPWVILKWAQSLDGKIATHTGDSKWISDARARRHAHGVRGRLDAIVVGANTVLTDDPMLTSRISRPRRVATRVVLDRRLKTPLESRLVQSAVQAPVLIYCAKDAPPRKRKAIAKAGCETIGTDSLVDVLHDLARRGCTNVLVEGGGTVLGSFLDAGYVDEVHCYLTPRLIGGKEAISAFAGKGATRIADALPLTHAKLRTLGSGWFVQARVTDPVSLCAD